MRHLRYGAVLFLVFSGCQTSFDKVAHDAEPSPPKTNASHPIKTSPALDPKEYSHVNAGSGNAATGVGGYRHVQDAPEASDNFKQAKDRVQAGQVRESLPFLEAYLKDHPEGQYADEANFFLGRTALSNNDPSNAIRFFAKVIQMKPPSKLRGQAQYLKAVAESQMGNRKESLNTLAKLEIPEIPLDQRFPLFAFWGDLALQEGRGLESTLAYLKAWKDGKDAERKKKIEETIVDEINTRLNEAELQFLLKEYPIDFPSTEVIVRLANVKWTAGQRDEAKQLLAKLIMQLQPGTANHKKATELLAKMGANQVANILRIGALLPSSGEQESLGRAVADGIREAFAKNLKPHALELVVADPGSTAETAKAAFDRLVSEDKVMAVIGPIGGVQAEAIAARSQEYGVPNITMAARSGLVEIGPYVFRVALTPEKQTYALVGYTHEKLKAHNFAILFPKDNFGREFAMGYFKAVKEWGGEVTAAETYDPSQSDFHIPIDNMTGMAFPQFRKTEQEELLKAQEDKLQRKLTRKESEAAGIHPIVDFDALLIPDTFRAVGQIVPALLYANVLTPKIMGPSTWNNPRLLNRAGQYLEGALFVDVFAPERQGKVTRDFVEQYQIHKGSMPSALAALGFDIGLAIREAYGSDSAPSTRDDLRSRLERLGGVEGACGVYSWDKRREPLSEVQLYLVKRGSFAYQGGIVIKPKN